MSAVHPLKSAPISPCTPDFSASTTPTTTPTTQQQRQQQLAALMSGTGDPLAATRHHNHHNNNNNGNVGGDDVDEEEAAAAAFVDAGKTVRGYDAATTGESAEEEVKSCCGSDGSDGAAVPPLEKGPPALPLAESPASSSLPRGDEQQRADAPAPLIGAVPDRLVLRAPWNFHASGSGGGGVAATAAATPGEDGAEEEVDPTTAATRALYRFNQLHYAAAAAASDTDDEEDDDEEEEEAERYDDGAAAGGGRPRAELRLDGTSYPAFPGDDDNDDEAGEGAIGPTTGGAHAHRNNDDDKYRPSALSAAGATGGVLPTIPSAAAPTAVALTADGTLRSADTTNASTITFSMGNSMNRSFNSRALGYVRPPPYPPPPSSSLSGNRPPAATHSHSSSNEVLQAAGGMVRSSSGAEYSSAASACSPAFSSPSSVWRGGGAQVSMLTSPKGLRTTSGSGAFATTVASLRESSSFAGSISLGGPRPGGPGGSYSSSTNAAAAANGGGGGVRGNGGSVSPPYAYGTFFGDDENSELAGTFAAHNHTATNARLFGTDRSIDALSEDTFGTLVSTVYSQHQASSLFPSYPSQSQSQQLQQQQHGSPPWPALLGEEGEAVVAVAGIGGTPANADSECGAAAPVSTFLAAGGGSIGAAGSVASSRTSTTPQQHGPHPGQPPGNFLEGIAGFAREASRNVSPPPVPASITALVGRMRQQQQEEAGGPNVAAEVGGDEGPDERVLPHAPPPEPATASAAAAATRFADSLLTFLNAAPTPGGGVNVMQSGRTYGLRSGRGSPSTVSAAAAAAAAAAATAAAALNGVDQMSQHSLDDRGGGGVREPETATATGTDAFVSPTSTLIPSKDELGNSVSTRSELDHGLLSATMRPPSCLPIGAASAVAAQTWSSSGGPRSTTRSQPPPLPLPSPRELHQQQQQQQHSRQAAEGEEGCTTADQRRRGGAHVEVHREDSEAALDDVLFDTLTPETKATVAELSRELAAEVEAANMLPLDTNGALLFSARAATRAAAAAAVARGPPKPRRGGAEVAQHDEELQLRGGDGRRLWSPAPQPGHAVLSGCSSSCSSSSSQSPPVEASSHIKTITATTTTTAMPHSAGQQGATMAGGNIELAPADHAHEQQQQPPLDVPHYPFLLTTTNATTLPTHLAPHNTTSVNNNNNDDDDRKNNRKTKAAHDEPAVQTDSPRQPFPFPRGETAFCGASRDMNGRSSDDDADDGDAFASRGEALERRASAAHSENPYGNRNEQRGHGEGEEGQESLHHPQQQQQQQQQLPSHIVHPHPSLSTQLSLDGGGVSPGGGSVSTRIFYSDSAVPRGSMSMNSDLVVSSSFATTSPSHYLSSSIGAHSTGERHHIHHHTPVPARGAAGPTPPQLNLELEGLPTVRLAQGSAYSTNFANNNNNNTSSSSGGVAGNCGGADVHTPDAPLPTSSSHWDPSSNGDDEGAAEEDSVAQEPLCGEREGSSEHVEREEDGQRGGCDDAGEDADGAPLRSSSASGDAADKSSPDTGSSDTDDPFGAAVAVGVSAGGPVEEGEQPTTPAPEEKEEEKSGDADVHRHDDDDDCDELAPTPSAVSPSSFWGQWLSRTAATPRRPSLRRGSGPTPPLPAAHTEEAGTTTTTTAPLIHISDSPPSVVPPPSNEYALGDEYFYNPATDCVDDDDDDDDSSVATATEERAGPMSAVDAAFARRLATSRRVHHPFSHTIHSHSHNNNKSNSTGDDPHQQQHGTTTSDGAVEEQAAGRASSAETDTHEEEGLGSAFGDGAGRPAVAIRRVPLVRRVNLPPRQTAAAKGFSFAPPPSTGKAAAAPSAIGFAIPSSLAPPPPPTSAAQPLTLSAEQLAADGTPPPSPPEAPPIQPPSRPESPHQRRNHPHAAVAANGDSTTVAAAAAAAAPPQTADIAKSLLADLAREATRVAALRDTLRRWGVAPPSAAESHARDADPLHDNNNNNNATAAALETAPNGSDGAYDGDALAAAAMGADAHGDAAALRASAAAADPFIAPDASGVHGELSAYLDARRRGSIAANGDSNLSASGYTTNLAAVMASLPVLEEIAEWAGDHDNDNDVSGVAAPAVDTAAEDTSVKGLVGRGGDDDGADTAVQRVLAALRLRPIRNRELLDPAMPLWAAARLPPSDADEPSSPVNGAGDAAKWQSRVDVALTAAMAPAWWGGTATSPIPQQNHQQSQRRGGGPGGDGAEDGVVAAGEAEIAPLDVVLLLNEHRRLHPDPDAQAATSLAEVLAAAASGASSSPGTPGALRNGGTK